MEISGISHFSTIGAISASIPKVAPARLVPTSYLVQWLLYMPPGAILFGSLCMSSWIRYSSGHNSMKAKEHLRMLILVTLAWFLFWVIGLPDYYLQYSFKTMVIFDLAILPPIWFLVYRSAKYSKPGRRLIICLWWSFNYGTPYMIDNRNIDIEIKLGGIVTTDYIALEGTFEATGDYISGDFELDNGGAVCSGSWEAEPI